MRDEPSLERGSTVDQFTRFEASDTLAFHIDDDGDLELRITGPVHTWNMTSIRDYLCADLGIKDLQASMLLEDFSRKISQVQMMGILDAHRKE